MDRLVLDVSGVGLELSVARSTLISLGQTGDEVTVAAALSIRESEWTIFGFKSQSERQLFFLLQSVTGIGPKLALALVGTLGVETLVDAVVTENQKMISQAPGVGPKVAQRIILELKGKMEEFARSYSAEAPQAASGPASGAAVIEEVTDILSHYGYTPTEIHSVLKTAREKGVPFDTAEELLRFALKALGSPVK